MRKTRKPTIWIPQLIDDASMRVDFIEADEMVRRIGRRELLNMIDVREYRDSSIVTSNIANTFPRVSWNAMSNFTTRPHRGDHCILLGWASLYVGWRCAPQHGLQQHQSPTRWV